MADVTGHKAPHVILKTALSMFSSRRPDRTEMVSASLVMALAAWCQACGVSAVDVCAQLTKVMANMRKGKSGELN